MSDEYLTGWDGRVFGWSGALVTRRLRLILLLGLIALVIGMILSNHAGRHHRRQAALRLISASNLRAIQVRLHLWADTHEGEFPRDLGSLVVLELIEPRDALSPRSDRTWRDLEAAMKKPLEEQAAWVNEHSDYIYRAEVSNTNMSADEIIAYARIYPELEGGISILYGDGHVRFVVWDKVREEFVRVGIPIPQVLKDKLAE
jgi:prepilin-type processing-associated H-X9-DG protein